MDIARIEAAAARLKGHALRTPLLNSARLDEIAGRRILVKAECLQRTGSFKFRGAWSAISALPEDQRAKGILAFSSGNHAQGVAHAAQIHGVPAVILMPEDAPKAKVEGTRAYGAEVVFFDRATQDRDAMGSALAEKRGLTLIKPFDNPDVLAGQGTCGLEIAEQAANIGVTEADVLVCCGGGGLTAGISLALEAKAPGMTVRPTEPEGFDDAKRSLETGVLQHNTQLTGNICDAILTPSLGELPFPVLKRLCGPGLTASEDEALQAMKLAAEHLKIIVEPGGAIALACALFRGDQLSETVICTASGGNVDAEVLNRALAL